MNSIFDIDNLMDDIPLTYEECNEVDDTNYAEQESILDEWLKSEEGGEKNE